jgi:hypothetical protein
MDISTLIAQVKANTDVEDSAGLLLKDLKTRLDAAIAALPNQAQLVQLQTDLNTHATALAAAVAANTPAAQAKPKKP